MQAVDLRAKRVSRRDSNSEVQGERNAGVRRYPHTHDALTPIGAIQGNYLGGLAGITFCQQEINTCVQTPLPEWPYQRSPQFFHRDSDEAVAERLAAYLFKLSPSFQIERKPV